MVNFFIYLFISKKTIIDEKIISESSTVKWSCEKLSNKNAIKRIDKRGINDNVLLLIELLDVKTFKP